MEITLIQQGHPLWDKVAAYADACPWKAGPSLARRMRAGDIDGWERVVVASARGAICAFLTLTAKDSMPASCEYTPFIGHVFVDEPFRGHRLSASMIDVAAAYAASLGFKEVYLTSGEVGLYEKYGFSKLGDVETRHGRHEQLFSRRIG